ncbi:MAG TPA: sensor histidine kinase [Gaiellaceae bacterium]|nr:sensor histidine kinase [Gaiellaceae bacterium]
MKWLQRAWRTIQRHPFAGDAALAAALAGIVLSDIWTSADYYTASQAIYVSAALLMTLPLAWRRKAPLPVAAVVMGALVFESLAVGSAPTPDYQLVGWLIAIYTVAAHCGRRAALAGGAISLAAGLIWMGVDDFLFPVVVFGGAWLAGRLVRQRDVHAQVMEERSAALAREREANARATAAEERARIARELHDVLSHSVSVMVVQAGAERMALGSERSATAEALEAIERTGRQALAEMRRLLGMLRLGDEPPAHAPQPTLADLDALVSQVREAGVPVEVHVEGEPVLLPPGVAVSAYRILQEALTNVLKHAGPAHARVIVRYGGRELELEIADDGRGPQDAAEAGHGLVGMRERVALYDGHFDAGARNGGGFVVRVRLPLTATQV